MSIFLAVGAIEIPSTSVFKTALPAVVFFATRLTEVVICWWLVIYFLLFLLHVLVERFPDLPLLM